jgi:tagatose 1,6-diphosphate aldolase
LEPLSYSLKPTVKKLCSESKRRVVSEAAPRLTPLGVDILKAEFPLEITETPDEHVCFSACAEFTEASHLP